MIITDDFLKDYASEAYREGMRAENVSDLVDEIELNYSDTAMTENQIDVLRWELKRLEEEEQNSKRTADWLGCIEFWGIPVKSGEWI